MAQRKFTDEMRDICENWNLSRDAALLEHLENLSKNVIKECEGILQSVKEIEFDVNRTAISVLTSRNSLQALSDTQFIENKIEEIEELDISENCEKFGSHSKQEDSITSPHGTDCIRTSILAGVKIIDENFEVIPIPKNDSDSEDDDEEVILKARNNFLSRPIPHLIGSTDFFRDNTVGILEVSSQEESEDEMPSPKSSGSLNEEITSQSQMTEPTSITPSLSYPTPLYPPLEASQGPSLTPSFQDQLSAKLHSASQNDPADIHRIIGKTGPPQLFPSSGSTSEDENSSLLDHTPPSSKQTLSESVLPTCSITQETLPTQSVDPQGESENLPPKKLISDREKSITSSILNEILSKNILQNNSFINEQPKVEPERVNAEPKAVSPELFENFDSFLPKPPTRTQTAKKSEKSSLTKSLFESSSDEDEPVPQWIPENSRNQERFHSDIKNIQGNSYSDKVPPHSDIKNIQGNSYSDKVPPPYFPSSVTSVDNVDNAAIVNRNVPLDQETIAPPANKYKSNLTKVLPDIRNAKSLKNSVPSKNTEQVEQSNGNKEAERSKKGAQPNIEPNNKAEKKIPSIFDESDDEIIDYPKHSKTSQPPPSNEMPKPEQKTISNQEKKKILSIFDEDSDDDIIINGPPKTAKKEEPKPKLRSEIPRNERSILRENKTNQQTTKELNHNNFEGENNDDIFSEVLPKSSTSSNPSKVPESTAETNQPTNSKIRVDDIFVLDKTDNTNQLVKKPVVSLFSDSDSEDDLFAIPKSSRESKPTNSVNDDDLFGIPKLNSVKDDDLFDIPKPLLETNPISSSGKDNEDLLATPKPKLKSILVVKDEDVSAIPKPNSEIQAINDADSFPIPKSKIETNRSDSLVEEDDLFAGPKPKLKTKPSSVVDKTNLEKTSQKLFNNLSSDMLDEFDEEANTTPNSSAISTSETNESDALNVTNELPKAETKDVDLKVEPSITSQETTLETSSIRDSYLNLFSDDYSDEPQNVTSSLSNPEEKVEKMSEQKEVPSQNSFDSRPELPKDVNINIIAVNKANGKDNELYKEEISMIKETPPLFVKSKDELDLFKKDKKKTIDLFNSNDSENSDSDLWDNIPKSKTTPRNIDDEKVVEPVPYEVKTDEIEKSKHSAESELPSIKENVSGKQENNMGKLEISLSKDSGDVLTHQTNKDKSEKDLVATEAETKSSTVADLKKSLIMFENNQPKTDVNVEEEKSTSSSKVLSIVKSFSLSSESEPSSPLFPEDKSVRSVKVTTEAKIITKTSKDNPDGIVSSIVKKPEKLPASMKLNINLAGLVPGQAFTKKSIDSLAKNDKTSEDPSESDRTPDLLPSTASDISPLSDLTSPETATGFLPSLTKDRAKILTKRRPPTKRGPVKSADLSQDTIDSVPTMEPSNEENPTKDSESTISTQPSNGPVVSRDSLSLYADEGQSSIETNTIVKLTNEYTNQGSSKTKETTTKPSTNEKKSLPKASDSILADNFLDNKKISIFDNSDDEDDIFNELAAKKNQLESVKQNSIIVQKPEISEIAVSKPASTDIKTSSKSSRKSIDDTSNVATAIHVKDTRHENISNSDVKPVEPEIKPSQTQTSNTSNASSSKTLFSNANKLKKNTILFNDDNDDDDDDLFGPISKAQNISTRKISNASNDKGIVTKASENVNSVDKSLKKSDLSFDKPRETPETKIEPRQDILNKESKNVDYTNKANDKLPAKVFVKSEVNVSNSKPSANSSSSRKTNAKKSTLFGDDDSDEDLFESLNKSKNKQNNNNNKIDNNGKLFKDNQSDDDDDDLFKTSSKDISSGSKKHYTSSNKTVPQNRTQEHLEDPLSKF